MTDTEILAQVKKGIDLFQDGTYEMKDLYSHMLQVIRENSANALVHIHQLERLIFKVDELRETQRLVRGGHTGKLPLCREQEANMDRKTHHLLTAGGYSIERFKNKVVQQALL